MIGRHAGHFHVIRSLGSGGMGVVYEAQDTRLPRTVALKFLKPEFARDVDAVRRFKREARLAATLNHPNICTVLDVSEGDGHPFIAMELLHGRSLRTRLANGPSTLKDILTVATQLAEGLGAAHDQGIMHRDITPGNIFLCDNGLVKLLDFGLAKHFATAEEADVVTDLTRPGVVVGTVHYMAPELFADGAIADHRCDLYSLGAVLYEMATDSRPFEAPAKDQVMEAIRRRPHIPLRRLAPHCPVALEGIVDRLLAKRPDDRYQTSWLLRADLQALQRQKAPEPATPSRAPRGPQRTLAIVPFNVIGGGADRADVGVAFARRLAEALERHRVGRVAGVDVRHAAAVGSIRDLGVRVGAGTVVEGSLQQAGGRVRALATLIDAATERPAAPAIRIEQPEGTDLAAAVAERIAAQLQQGPHLAMSRNAEAAAAFKRGLHHWQARFSGGWREAIEHFQRAVQRDESFGLAHVALASAYEFLGFYGLMKPVLAFDVARTSIEQALAIDDTLAAAHTELALIRFGGDWDWEGSEQAFRRAIQLDPSNAVAHVCYSWLLMLLGREDAALAEARAGHGLGADSRFAASGHAQTLYMAQRYDDAIALCDDCLRTDPDYVFAVALRGQCYELTSRWQEAIADLEHAATLTGRAPFYLGVLGHCYGKAGERSRARKLLDELRRLGQETYVPPQCYVYIHAGLGDRARAFEYQERAYEDGASPFNYFAPSIRDLYALDPQHKRRLEQMRLNL